MFQMGVDLGGHTLIAAVIETDAFDGTFPHIVQKIEVPTPEGRSFEAVTDEIVRLLTELSEGCSLSAGIAVPGMLDRSRLQLLRLPNFPNWDGAPLLEVLAEKLMDKGIIPDLKMENDANCYTIGEGLAGVARNCRDYVLFTLGTGIGGGVVVDGRLLTGFHGMAAELGHLALFSSPSCGCGGRGHLESIASADALEKEALKVGFPVDFKQLWLCREEKAIRDILAAGMDAMGRAIASVVHVLDPQMVVLGGGMSRAEGLKEQIEERTIPYLASPFKETFSIAQSVLGNEAALFGAALLRHNRGKD